MQPQSEQSLPLSFLLQETHGAAKSHLVRLGLYADLAPGDGLVRVRPAVAAVEGLRRVDKDGKVGAIAEQVGIADVVLGHAWGTKKIQAMQLKASMVD